MKEAVRLSGSNARFVAHIAYAEAVAGHDQEARRIRAELLSRAQTEYVSPVSLARIYSELANRERAVGWVEIAYRTRALDITRLFSEPEFEPLHADGRVRDMMARVGLLR